MPLPSILANAEPQRVTDPRTTVNRDLEERTTEATDQLSDFYGPLQQRLRRLFFKVGDLGRRLMSLGQGLT